MGHLDHHISPVIEVDDVRSLPAKSGRSLLSHQVRPVGVIIEREQVIIQQIESRPGVLQVSNHQSLNCGSELSDLVIGRSDEGTAASAGNPNYVRFYFSH